MEANKKIVLPVACPVKWNSMNPSEEGRFCAVCEKTVRDFTKKTPDEIAASEDSKKYECGSFYASQLDKPFGDWRDKLIAFYQHLLRRTNPKKGILFFVTLLLFISGCRSRRGGAPVYSWDYKGNTDTTVAAENVKEPAGLK
jgi:hypothetical protein